MIIYNNEILFGYAQYFHVYGSAIFTTGCLPQALISAALACYATFEADDWRGRVVNPTAYFSGISLVLGFLLVFRTQLAYSRYWEGRTNMQILMSKLEDVAIHTKSFIQAEDNEALQWKFAMGWKLINYLALVIADLRGESDDLTAVIEKYKIVMEKAEVEELQKTNFRPYHMMSTIVDTWVKYSRIPGRVSVTPPIQSRTYQIISEAQLAFNGAQKIQTTPFPYPLMQVCGMLLHVYMFSAPLVIGAYLQNPIFGTVLSFFSVLGFFALNRTAEELEDPFGNDPNDLPLDTYLNTFRQSMFSIGIMRGSKKNWSNLKVGLKVGLGSGFASLLSKKSPAADSESPSEGAASPSAASPGASRKSEDTLEFKTARLMQRDSFKAILAPSEQDLATADASVTPQEKKSEVEEDKTSCITTIMEFLNPQVTHSHRPMTAEAKKKFEDLSFYHQY